VESAGWSRSLPFFCGGYIVAMDRESLKWRVAAIPVIGIGLRRIHRAFTQKRWENSRTYWEKNYISGGTSGPGSYGRLAQAKAKFLNDFVSAHQIRTVLEIGCGDGNQLSLAQYPSYVGVDISSVTIDACRARFADDLTKSFLIAGSAPLPTCELGLSLDVIFHLVEDEIFERYMLDLLSHSERYVVLYTSDSDAYLPTDDTPLHVRHRPVGRWMSNQGDWRFKERYPNPYPYQRGHYDTTSPADFYVYERVVPLER
jgi:SAM-dependent methyltransferase